MARTRFRFPLNFKFGAATSSLQIDGEEAGQSGESDIGITARIHSRTEIDASGQSVPVHPYGPDGEYMAPIGKACDHRNLYMQDTALLNEMGFGTYRMSLPWGEIEPTRTELWQEPDWNYAVIERIRSELLELRRLNIVPQITLQHFDTPAWMYPEGAWEAKSMPAYFARYARKIAEEFGPIIAADPPGTIFTLNEMNTGLLNEFERGGPENRLRRPAWIETAAVLGADIAHFRPWKLAWTTECLRTIVRSHQEAFRATKAVDPRIRVGLTMASQDIVPVAAEFAQAADDLWMAREGRLWEILKEDPETIEEIIGVQPYTHLRVGRRPDGTVGILLPPQGARVVAQGYEYAAPDALYNTVRRMADMFPGTPLLITEYGIGTPDDNMRVDYTRDGMRAVAQLLKEGVPLEGIDFWSLMDNFEWGHAYVAPYGYVGVDFDTQSRTIKPSGEYVMELCRTRTIDLDTPGPSASIAQPFVPY